MSTQATYPRVGDFELLAKLGAGGMGAVYKARQLSLERLVALKLLDPQLGAKDPAFAERFLSEARATARLNHPHIVAGYDVGSADGYRYFAMEFVEGENLKTRIQRLGVLPEMEIGRIGAAIASALEHAHRAGIVHRDVKPDNILLDADATPKLADLGLAKSVLREDGSLTQAGSTVGTPHYIAPEQAEGRADIDGRADQYALGCTLFHAATGRTPFEAPTAAVLMVKHLNERMPHPRSLNPDLSDGFCHVIGRMVARDPRDRYADMRLLVEDLERIAHGEAPLQGALPPSKSNFLSGPKAPRLATSRALRSAGRSDSSKNIRSAGSESGGTSRFLPVAGSRSVQRRAVGRGPAKPEIPAMVYLSAGAAGLIMIVLALMLFGGGQSKPAPERTVGNKDDEVPAHLRLPEQPSQPAQSVPRPASKPPTRPIPAQDPVPAPTPVALPGTMFNGRDLTGWEIRDPNWRVEDGALVGSGIEENARLYFSDGVPRDFELSFTIQSKGSFHVVWTCREELTPMDTLHLERFDELNISRYWGNGKGRESLTSTKLANPQGPHRFRILVHESLVRVFVDGQQQLEIRDGKKTSQARRNLGFYVHKSSETRFSEFNLRDLSGVSAKDFNFVPPEDQIKRVRAELVRRNPRFDGILEHRIEGGKVTSLALSAHHLMDISPLQSLRGLKELKFLGGASSRSELSDLSPLKGLPLEWLQIDFTQVADLSPLRSMPLGTLYADVTPVRDLSPLSGMPLKHLQVSWSKVEDLSPLRGLKLERLRLDGSPVRDLSPLAGQPIRTLIAREVAAADWQVLRSLPLVDLQLEYDAAKHGPLLAGCKTLKTINGEPAEKVLQDAASESASGEGVPIFNERNLDEWRKRAPCWTFEDGKLVCRKPPLSGFIQRNMPLPDAFELSFQYESESSITVGWDGSADGTGSAMIALDADGEVRMKHYRPNRPSAQVANSAERFKGDRHTCRLVVRGPEVRVEVDGKEYLSGRYPASITRKMNIHLHAREGTAEARFWEIRLKDLSGK